MSCKAGANERKEEMMLLKYNQFNFLTVKTSRKKRTDPP
jgi:hypothetical protein